MPYPRPSMLAQWTADVGSPNPTGEIVVGSMRFAPTSKAAPDSDVDGVDNDDAAQQVLAKLQTFWTAPGAFIGSVVIREFRWNKLDVNGHYASDKTRLIDGLSISGGAQSGSTLHAPQIAWATTWTTGTSRGLAHYGRTYWPTMVPIAPDFRVTVDRAKAMSVLCAQLISDWANWDGIDTTSMAPVIGSKQGAGAFKAITGSKVGRVLDTIRARRNQLDEDYQATPVTF